MRRQRPAPGRSPARDESAAIVATSHIGRVLVGVRENIFYSISVAIMVMVGTLAFLLLPTANAALTITLGLGAVAIVAVVAVCG